MVVDEQFGDRTLPVHQETVSSSLLSEGGPVAHGNQSVQLQLPTAHQLHKLGEKRFGSRFFFLCILDVSIQKHSVLCPCTSDTISTARTKTNFTEQRVTFTSEGKAEGKGQARRLHVEEAVTHFLPVSDRNHEIFALRRLTFPLK